MGIVVTSPSFDHNGRIPSRFTCDDADVNPALRIGDVPGDAKSLVLIMDDPDAPGGTWDHWIVWNIDPSATFEENNVPGGAVQGKNSWGKNDYGGPCPPSGTHRYFFKVYALDTLLDLSSRSDKKAVEKAMKGHVLAQGELIGLYSRN
jgi:Raf kinase inhibitor-like YbhB/YbcL family protein